MQWTIIHAAAFLGKWAALVLATSWRQRFTTCDGNTCFFIYLLHSLFLINIPFVFAILALAIDIARARIANVRYFD